jgi:putative transposase
VSDVAERLKTLIMEVCNKLGIVIVGIEIMPDHVHLLVDVGPQFGIHKAIKSIKGTTSRTLRQEFKFLTTKLPTLWTNSYFVATVGNASLDVVKKYIEEQKTSQRR